MTTATMFTSVPEAAFLATAGLPADAPASSGSAPQTARALRAVLSDAGIRSTQRTPAPHRTDVLVFPDDAARSRSLAASFSG